MRRQQAALTTYRDTLQLPSKRDKVRERRRNQLYYSPHQKPAQVLLPRSPTREEAIRATHTVDKFYELFIQVIYLTSQFIIIRCKLCMIFLASAFHQVVHNRGHGFSKRFNPAGVHNVTKRCSTLRAMQLAYFRGMLAEYQIGRAHV